MYLKGLKSEANPEFVRIQSPTWVYFFFNLQVVCLHHQVALLSRKPACYYPSKGCRDCDSLTDESIHCGGKLIRCL